MFATNILRIIVFSLALVLISFGTASAEELHEDATALQQLWQGVRVGAATIADFASNVWSGLKTGVTVAYNLLELDAKRDAFIGWIANVGAFFSEFTKAQQRIHHAEPSSTRTDGQRTAGRVSVVIRDPDTSPYVLDDWPLPNSEQPSRYFVEQGLVPDLESWAQMESELERRRQAGALRIPPNYTERPDVFGGTGTYVFELPPDARVAFETWTDKPLMVRAGRPVDVLVYWNAVFVDEQGNYVAVDATRSPIWVTIPGENHPVPVCKQIYDGTVKLPAPYNSEVPFRHVYQVYAHDTSLGDGTRTNGIQCDNGYRANFITSINQDVRTPSGLTGDQIDVALRTHRGGPLVGLGQYFVEAERRYGVNAVFLAAIAMHETGRGTSNLLREKNNLFGFAAYDDNPMGHAVSYNAMYESIFDAAKNFRDHYFQRSSRGYHNRSDGLTTIWEIGTIYATDPQWAEKVYLWVQLLQNAIAESPETVW